MIEIAYPSSFEQRVLALEGPGGPPARVGLVAPTITTPGRCFTLKVALHDEAAFPSVEYDGAVRIRADFARPSEFEVPFRKGRPAVAAVHGVAIESEGMFRFQAELDGKTFHANPTRCMDNPAHFIYWGDPHVHTVISRCHPAKCRSLNFCYVAGRHLAGLDWVTAADHVSNGRSDLGKWKEQIAASEVFNDPEHFVTLPGYEVSLKGGAGGDTNPYILRWTDMFVDEYEEGTARTLCEKLAAQLAEGEFFVVPHHTTRTGKHGEIPEEIYPGPERMPVVEITSRWGTSEYRGNPNPLKKIHPGPSYVVDLLNQGLMLGFIGGTDTHATMPALHAGGDNPNIDRFPGLTAVKADRLTRENVFHGIRTRNCYAASLERVYIDETIASAPGGSKLAWADPTRPREIQVAAAAQSDIVSIDVVRNGRTIHSASPDNWLAGLAFTDAENLPDACLESKHLGRFVYYYVRVTCRSGAQGWSSPVWLVL